MSFCLAGPWQSVLPPPSPLDIRSPEKRWFLQSTYRIWFWLQCRNIPEKIGMFRHDIWWRIKNIKMWQLSSGCNLSILWILWYLHKTEFLPKFTLFWFMKSDVGALGVGLNVSASELNLPLSEPKLLKMFGAGLNSFGGRLNLFGAKLKSRGGELNSLDKSWIFTFSWYILISYLKEVLSLISYLKGGFAYFFSTLGEGVIEGRGSGSKFLQQVKYLIL